MTITSSAASMTWAGGRRVAVEVSMPPCDRRGVRQCGTTATRAPAELFAHTGSVRKHAMPATWPCTPRGRKSCSGHRRSVVDAASNGFILRSSTKLYVFASGANGAKSATDEDDEAKQRVRVVEMTAARFTGGSSHCFHRHSGPALCGKLITVGK